MPSRRAHAIRVIAVLALGLVPGSAAPAWSSVAPALPASVVAAATPAPPSVPARPTATGYVDGVRVRWQRGPVTAEAPAPTSYLLTRSGPDSGTVSVTIPTAPSSSAWSYDDRSAPAGEPVTYAVTSVAAGGASDASGTSDPVTRPPWDGPYDGARTALVMVWDTAAITPPFTDLSLDSVVADSGLTDRAGGADAVGLDWWRSVDLVMLPDGTYAVGGADGEVPFRARAGAWCLATSGQLTVSRTAFGLAGLAAQSLDADVRCANGHRLTVALRWGTPEPVALPRMPAPAVATVAPGADGVAVATLVNEGSASLDVDGVDLLPYSAGDSALTVRETTCSGDLDPGASCTATLRFAPAGDARLESRSLLVLHSTTGAIEAGTVVGQLAGRGQPAPSVTAAARGVGLSWSIPPSVSDGIVTGYRVERQDPSGPTVLATMSTSYPVATWSRDIGDLPHGTYLLRVVALTTDGRELPSPWITVHVPTSWLLLATDTGILSVNPDDGWAPGGTFGYPDPDSSWRAIGLSALPDRTGVVTAFAGLSYGYVATATPTGGSGGRDIRTYPDGHPDVSPDGTQVVLTRPHRAGGAAVDQAGGLVLLDPGSGTVVDVPGSEDLSGAVWQPDGRKLLAVSSAGIVRVDPKTGSRTTVLAHGGIDAIAVSRSGRLAYIAHAAYWDQQIYETTLTSTGTGSGTRFVAGVPLALGVRYDPTGRYLFVAASPYTNGGVSRLFDLSPTTPALVATLPVAADAAWWDPVSSAPTATISVPRWTASTPTLTVAWSDPDDQPGGLVARCRVDAGAWTACAASWRPGRLSAGTHTATVEVTDPSGAVGTTSRTWRVDAAAPVAAAPSVPSVVLGRLLSVSWSATDSGGSGPDRYDIRIRRATSTAGYASRYYPASLQGVTRRSATMAVTPGFAYCLSVRVRDGAGNVGAWGPERCAAVTLDDRSLSASSGWSRRTSSGALYGTLTSAHRTGLRLTRTKVSTRRIAVLATTCAACGAVDVYLGSTKIGRVSLTSSATRNRQLRWLPTLPTTRTGTLSLRTASWRAVHIDGVVIAH